LLRPSQDVKPAEKGLYFFRPTKRPVKNECPCLGVMTCKILIFEREVFRHSGLTSWLLRKGCRVWETALPSEAADILQAENIDVVLLDVREIKEEGLTLLRNIKTLSPLTEVILLTAPGQIALSIQGMKLGAFDDLLVPVDIDVLTAKLDEAAGRKRQNQRTLQVTCSVSSQAGVPKPGLSDPLILPRSGSPITPRT